jgi:dolichol-phosphate mannosyltransferase
MNNKLLIFIPTFNEAENVKIIYQMIKAIHFTIPYDILFLDDNSPDGTGDIIDQLSKEDPTVFAIHRQGKEGIGSAHLVGIDWAYRNKYEALITMDCDLTHSPEYILDFYTSGKQFPVVIGSRYMDQESLKTWNVFRKTLTRFGHFLTKHLLDMPYDASGAFRFYDLKRIPHGIFLLVESRSYSFFFESLLILQLNKIAIKEISIRLPKRTYGNSKMNFRDAWTSLQFLFKMFIKKKFKLNSLVYNGK